MKGGIVLKKTGAEGQALSGAEYSLFKVEEDGTETRWPDNMTTFTSDENGEAVAGNLMPGKYRFRETKAPEGYTVSDLPVDAEVSTPSDLLLNETVQGGETEVFFTPDNAEFEPEWEGVPDAATNENLHYLKLKSGTEIRKKASEYGADSFLKNGGSGIQLLKGEPASGQNLTEDINETVITLKKGGVTAGTFHSAAEAKAAVNKMIADRQFKSEADHLTAEAHFVYADQDRTHYTKVFQTDEKIKNPHPVPVTKTDRVKVLKTWDNAEHPSYARFRLMQKKADGTVRQVGEIRTADEGNNWEAEWNLRETATLSDASVSNATLSDALLFDEDGKLLDGVVTDHLFDSFYAEEIDVPEGWKAVYELPDISTENGIKTAEYKIRNLKIPETGTPSEIPGPPNPVTPSGGGGTGGSGPGNPAVPPVPVENIVLMENEIPEWSSYEMLPYGRIAKKRLPRTGEPADTKANFLLCVILAGMLMLAAAAVQRLTETHNTGKGRG